MIRYDVIRHLADGAPGAGTTLAATVITAIATVIVAFVGFLGTRVLARRTDEEPAGEEELVVYLRKEVDRKEKTIRRLTRYCYLAGVDPDTGNRLEPGSVPPEN